MQTILKIHHAAIALLLSFAALSVHTGMCQQRVASRLGREKSVLMNGVLVQEADRHREASALWKNTAASTQQLPLQKLYGPFGSTVRNFMRAPDGSVYLCSESGLYKAKSILDRWEKITLPGNGYLFAMEKMIAFRDGAIFVFGDPHVYRSTDFGATWSTSSENSDIRDVAIDSAGIFYAASYQRGLLSSADRGLSWKPFSLSDKQLLSMILTDSGTLICGSTKKLYISENHGVRWDSVEVDGTAVYSLRKGSTGALYALTEDSLYSSRDDGKTWRTIDVLRDWFYRFYIDENDYLYLVGINGIQRSTDEGKSWKKLAPIDDDLLCMHPFSKDTLAAGSFYGVNVSTDGGATWRRNDSGLVSLSIRTVKEAKNSNIIAIGGRTIFTSSDNGGHWQPRYRSWALGSALAMDSAGVLYVPDFNVIQHSVDNGETWTPLQDSLGFYIPTSIVTLPPSAILAGTIYSEIFRSEDNGASWKKVFTDGRKRGIWSLTVDRHGKVYCVTATSVLKSTDGGVNWIDVSDASVKSELTKIFSVNDDLFIIPSDGGVHRSANGGTTWESFSNVLSSQYVSTIADNHQGRLLAATFSGLCESNDRGTQWTRLDDNNFSGEYSVLYVTAKGYLFAGSRKDGLYRSGSAITSVEPTSQPTVFSLEQNFPNPFNPTTTISYAIPQPGMVSLKVYDILGREISTLVNEYKMQGRYNVPFDAGRLSSGMYIYRIQAGTFSAVKKMNVVK